MVNNIVHATYTETYDLNTAVGELSLLGIHTPQSGALKQMFKGFFTQYKKYKILGCNLRMVCASQQSLDPSQMGLEAGQVDPRDVLNPILFKACTGETINALLDVIYNDDGLATGKGTSISQNVLSADALNMYYKLLADDTWRKSHPQAGLEVSHLIPMVHNIVSTRPFKWTGQYAGNIASGETFPSIKNLSNQDPNANAQVHGFNAPGYSLLAEGGGNIANSFVTNGMSSMPWLDTVVPQSRMEDAEGNMAVGNYLISAVPRVYMGCIVLPPAILQRLFFRMTIVWHIQFKDFRPAFEVGPIGFTQSDVLESMPNLIEPGDTYFNIYHNPTPTRGITKEVSSFTTTESTEVDDVLKKVQ